MPRASRVHSNTIGARGAASGPAKPPGMNRTAAPALRRRKGASAEDNPAFSSVPQSTASSEALGETVLLLENRFFRPGGIRVGTMEQMMFRPGLAPDHHSPPPAFRRTTRQAVIPYSKGRPYRKEIGVGKLAETTSEKRENTRLKLVQMLGGDVKAEQDRKLARQKYDALRASRRQSRARHSHAACTWYWEASAGSGCVRPRC